jgi:hypothetical protein
VARTFEQVLSVLPARSREEFTALGRQVHAAGKAGAARAPHLGTMREYLLSQLANARYAVPSDDELQQMVDVFFAKKPG